MTAKQGLLGGRDNDVRFIVADALGDSGEKREKIVWKQQ